MDALHGLTVWNRACQLSIDTYKALAECSDSVFREQINRASIAIPSNIAEGYERMSRPQFAQYLRVAKGSCAELRTQLHLAAEVGLVDNGVSDPLVAESIEISKMITGLIKRCERLR